MLNAGCQHIPKSPAAEMAATSLGGWLWLKIQTSSTVVWLAVADISNSHYSNLTSFIKAGKSNVLEGVVVVDVVSGAATTPYIRCPIVGGENGLLASATCGGHHLALKSNGQLRTWGSPADLPPGVTHVAVIATAAAHWLDLRSAAMPMFPPQQVRLNNLGRVGNGFSVSVPTRNRRVHALEYKDSLDGTTWATLPLVAGNGGTLTLTDSAATAPPSLNRVRQW